MWHHLTKIELFGCGPYGYDVAWVKIICNTHDNLRVLSQVLLSLECSEVTINFSLFTVTAALPTMHYISRNKINRVWHQLGRDQDYYLTLLDKSKATATATM
jgi:hypothetical protein